ARRQQRAVARNSRRVGAFGCGPAACTEQARAHGTDQGERTQHGYLRAGVASGAFGVAAAGVLAAGGGASLPKKRMSSTHSSTGRCSVLALKLMFISRSLSKRTSVPQPCCCSSFQRTT